MARTTLDERGVRASLVGAAFVSDMRLAFTLPSLRWTGYAADLVAAPGERAWGVLWDLENPQSLDEFERRYNRRTLTARTDNGSISRHRTYKYTVKSAHRAAEEGTPAPEYLQRMLDGARDAGLPGSYAQFLMGLSH